MRGGDIESRAMGRLVAGAVLSCGLGVACGAGTVTVPSGTDAELAAIELSPETLTFSALGESDTLVAVGRDPEGRIVSVEIESWDSSKPGVASVSGSGVVTAVGEGSATISATAEDVRSNPVTVTVAPSSPSGFRCTLVIGFSQTHGWFSAGFESVVDDDEWQEIWRSGAAIDLWADPSFAGWSRPLVSPCTDRPDDPDRVLLTISADFQDDPGWWADNILLAVANIRDRYPGVREIMLQPVVGGPNHTRCAPNGERASQNHPVIDEAITLVEGGDIVAGFSPEVRSCADYVDFVGHLTSEASEAVATTLGEYYRTVD